METAASVPEEAEPLVGTPIEDHVDTPAPVESIQVISFQSRLLMIFYFFK